MAISVVCPHCRKKLRAKDEYEGRRVKCPACNAELVISGEEASPHDVFISYSNRDKATADAMCASLESERIRCWIAPRDILPGIEWGEGIIEAINESRLMVLVYSASSNTSPQVRRELERAVSKDIPILPFRIENVPASKSMEYFISTQHWLDAMTPPLEQHLQRLAETVNSLLTRSAEETTSAAESGGHASMASKPAVRQSFANRFKKLPLLAKLAMLALVVLVVVFVAAVGSHKLAQTPVAGTSEDSDLPDDSDVDWTPLFNGKDLTGWSLLEYVKRGRPFKPTNKGWRVRRDGAVVCTTNATTVLCSEGQYSDFILELEFQLPAGGAFVVGLRTPREIEDKTDSAIVPILDEARFRDVLRTDPRASSNAELVLVMDKVSQAVRPEGEWNRLQVHCEQDELRETLNGKLVGSIEISTTFGADRPAGRIAILNLEGLAKETALRNIRIHELK